MVLCDSLRCLCMLFKLMDLRIAMLMRHFVMRVNILNYIDVFLNSFMLSVLDFLLLKQVLMMLSMKGSSLFFDSLVSSRC